MAGKTDTHLLDIVISVSSLIGIIGFHLDAEEHKADFGESVITLPHILMFVGIFTIVLFFVYIAVSNYATGLPFSELLQGKYQRGSLFMFIVAAFSFADWIRHDILGFEDTYIDLGFSITHLGGILFSFLLVGLPLHNLKGIHTSWQKSLANTLTALNLMNIFTIFTQVWHPFIVVEPLENDFVQLLRLLLHLIFVIALILYITKITHLPIGGFSIIFGLNGLLVATIQCPCFPLVSLSFTQIMISYLISGLVLDVILLIHYRTRSELIRAIIPQIFVLVYYGLYFYFVHQLLTVWTLDLIGSVILISSFAAYGVVILIDV